jgi:Arc/MetJ-type ribon-helix-helix transcriptional regulator
MLKSISVKRKKRGRPPTGVDPLVGVRLPPQMISNIDRWAKENDLSRSEAIRRLLEKALAGKGANRPPNKKAARKAAQMAASVIENLGDKSEPAVEQQQRKRTLIRGPKEFRDIRADLPKPKS